jgi:multimeric flavodoxin WrbA
MTKKILIFESSPRKKGNTAVLARQASEALISAGVEVETLHLHGMKIAPCNHCDGCIRKKVNCVIEDDMQAIYAKLAAADGVILASPIYWFSYNAQLKVFIDRLYGIAQIQSDFLKDKPMGAILVYGDSDVFTSGATNAIRIFEDTARWVKSGPVSFVYGTANDVGDAEKDAALMERARQLGEKMGKLLQQRVL